MIRKDTPPNKLNKNVTPKPDPETLNTTDPQEHMEGPVSSAMQKIKEGAKENEEDDDKKGKLDKK